MAQEVTDDWQGWIDRSRWRFILWRMAVRYGAEYVSIRAGMLAYFLFFSLFPLLLLLISVASYLIEPAQAEAVTFRLLQDFPEAVRDVIEANVRSAFAYRGQVTLIGLGTLAWSSLQVFFAIDYALNQVWDIEEYRPWYWLYLRATGVVGIGLLLVVLTLVAETSWQFFDTLLRPLVAAMAGEGLIALAAFGLSLLGAFGLFAGIYRWVPARHIDWRYVWPGALLAAGMWKLSQSAFAWYLRTLSKTAAVYGSIGVIISLLLWLYVSSLIMLVGALFNRALADWHRQENGPSCRNADQVDVQLPP